MKSLQSLQTLLVNRVLAPSCIVGGPDPEHNEVLKMLRLELALLMFSLLHQCVQLVHC